MANFPKNKVSRKKSHRVKKKLISKIIDSSEESEDEYRNKRRKLANAVVVNTPKTDTTSLRARLKKMFGTQSLDPVDPADTDVPALELNSYCTIESSTKSNTLENNNSLDIPLPQEISNSHSKLCELIDLCNDDELVIVDNHVHVNNTIDHIIQENNIGPKKSISGDSDEDLELLRQHALKTKSNKNKIDSVEKQVPEQKQLVLTEDEDSDTAELRLICLKSALLKKAIEMKQKQKMRKRLSQSIHEELLNDDGNVLRKSETGNNTDIESVDMDIGSDGDDKFKEISDQSHNIELNGEDNVHKSISVPVSSQKEEVDEDEDLLRAKLLTSLSKNWPNLVDPASIETLSDTYVSDPLSSIAKSKTSAPIEKPFIIKLGESDSEGEHEATKNLTKMHIKLSEQIDFQQKLDMFLKSTRMEVEKQTLPNVVLQPPEQPKQTPKYVAKVRYLTCTKDYYIKYFIIIIYYLVNNLFCISRLLDIYLSLNK